MPDALPPEGEAPGASPGVPLDALLVYVERAVHGDRRLLVQLFRVFQRLARQSGAPPEERRLGEVLSMVLMGDRCPDVSGLPDEMTREIQAMLERISG